MGQAASHPVRAQPGQPAAARHGKGLWHPALFGGRRQRHGASRHVPQERLPPDQWLVVPPGDRCGQLG
ncbi:hypothetical protein G6F22_021079 [Rhizopus arrhizus]|nr:hypothetical protein G6F22_021079 [Rhizopus arrhizus]KAG1165717.1 hypothetical protein G6F35_018619 [Rhizopus arrhizus]